MKTRRWALDDVLSHEVMGRIAAVLFVGCGVVTALSPLLPSPPGVDRVALVVVGGAAVLAGVITWFLPWHRWPPRASYVVLVPVAHVLIAAHNHVDGVDAYRYGLFFLVTYMWIGLSQPPGTSLMTVPFTAAMYLLPLVLADRPGWALASVLYAIPVFVLAGESIGMLAERLREAQASLAHLAFHDPLTGLPNRTLFAEWGDAALARARRQGFAVAVLFVDLDGFKGVNDRHGHDAGDELLVEVATRLRSALRSEEMVARLGGDEFAVLVADLPRSEDVTTVAKRLARALHPPFVLDGQELDVRASIGIASAEHGRTDVDALLRHSDQAMYRAKGRTGTTWAFAPAAPPGEREHERLHSPHA